MSICRFCYFKIETCRCNKGKFENKIIIERNKIIDFNDYIVAQKINKIMKPLKEKDKKTIQKTLV